MDAGYLDGTLELRRIKSMSLQPGQQGNEEVLDMLMCCRALEKVWLGDAEEEDGRSPSSSLSSAPSDCVIWA